VRAVILFQSGGGVLMLLLNHVAAGVDHPASW